MRYQRWVPRRGSMNRVSLVCGTKSLEFCRTVESFVLGAIAASTDSPCPRPTLLLQRSEYQAVPSHYVCGLATCMCPLSSTEYRGCWPCSSSPQECLLRTEYLLLLLLLLYSVVLLLFSGCLWAVGRHLLLAPSL